jgi:arsenite methyltransferase
MKQIALSPGERVLDVGCGPGFLCESIAAIVGRDGTAVGMDISSDLIALCRTRNPPKWLSYEVGDATQSGQPDASFDVVVCTQVAEPEGRIGRRRNPPLVVYHHERGGLRPTSCVLSS